MPRVGGRGPPWRGRRGGRRPLPPAPRCPHQWHRRRRPQRRRQGGIGTRRHQLEPVTATRSKNVPRSENAPQGEVRGSVSIRWVGGRRQLEMVPRSPLCVGMEGAGEGFNGEARAGRQGGHEALWRGVGQQSSLRATVDSHPTGIAQIPKQGSK